MATYSFMDVTATFAGPTGVIDLGYGSAAKKVFPSSSISPGTI